MQAKLIKNEFKATLTTFIIWTIIILLLVSVFISINPLLFSHSTNIINKLDILPNKVKVILFIDTNTFNTHIGYYAIMIEYLLIIGAICASVLAYKILLWDKINGYDEFLFTKPISRSKIFLNKIICFALLILIQNILFNLVSIILVKIIINSISIKTLIQINSSLLFSELTFGAISILTSSFIKKTKGIYKVPILTILILYLIAIPERVYNITILRYINPFSYFKVDDIIIDNHYKLSFIFASLIIIMFCLRISLINYEEGEIKIDID